MSFNYIKEKEKMDKFLIGLQKSKKFLTIGWRYDSGYWLFDDYVSKYFTFDTDQVYVLDAFCKNLEDFNKYNVTKICCDIRDFDYKKYSLNDVAIIWEHGPEHLIKKEAVKVINSMKKYASFIAIETPRGEYPQGELYGNPHEKHLSSWDFEDYKTYFPDFTTWHNDDHNPPLGVLGAFWSKHDI